MASAAREIVFATPPLTFNRVDALGYTGIASKLFASLEKSGQLTGRPYGRNGEVVYLREQLDAVTARLFGVSGTDINDEFEGLNG